MKTMLTIHTNDSRSELPRRSNKRKTLDILDVTATQLAARYSEQAINELETKTTHVARS